MKDERQTKNKTLEFANNAETAFFALYVLETKAVSQEHISGWWLQQVAYQYGKKMELLLLPTSKG